MEWLEPLGRWPGALWLQRSGTAYLFVNASHILGIGLILGSILPLDVRLMGFARSVPLGVIAPLLTRTAAIGVALALLTGAWLFSVRPLHYADNAAFVWKLAFVGLALANVALQHLDPGYRRALGGAQLSPAVRLKALASVLCWLTALVAGRWIGFL